MPATTAPLIMPEPASQKPPIFTDAELSEIFQIDFSEIFGSPDQGVKPSNYKGVHLPPSATSQKSSLTRKHEEDVSPARGIVC